MYQRKEMQSKKSNNSYNSISNTAQNLEQLPSPPKYILQDCDHPRQLTKNDFQIPQQSIGSGAQGEVYQIYFKHGDGTIKLDGSGNDDDYSYDDNDDDDNNSMHSNTKLISRFAMKKVSRQAFQKQRQEYLTELQLLYKLKHPNIIRYITHFQDEFNIYIVMEYIEGGNLLNKIQAVKQAKMNQTLNQNLLQSFLGQGKNSSRRLSEQGAAVACNNTCTKDEQVYKHVPRSKRSSFHLQTFNQLNILLQEVDRSQKATDFNTFTKERATKQAPSNLRLQYKQRKHNSTNNSMVFQNKIQKVVQLNIEECLKISRDILSALKYLHSNKIMHRDIKLQNILIDHKNRAKIIDFGFLCQLREGNAHLICGTVQYMAPQIKRQSYGFQAQVYACGVLMFELFTKIIQKAQQNLLDKQVLAKTNKKLKFPKIFVYQYPDIYELICRMVIHDPYERIRVDEALNHRAFLRISSTRDKMSSQLETLKEQNTKLKQQISQLRQQLAQKCIKQKLNDKSFSDKIR